MAKPNEILVTPAALRALAIIATLDGNSGEALDDAVSTAQAFWEINRKHGVRAADYLPTVRSFLVIGIYDDEQRWADSFEAETPEEAEQLALLSAPSVKIAGVVEQTKGSDGALEMQVVA